MAIVSTTAPATKVVSANSAPGISEALHDNVQTLDRLLLKLSQEATQQRRVGGWLRSGMQRLTHASEVALLATLLHRPVAEVRTQLTLIQRQLGLLIEMTRRSGRCAGRLYDDLCCARQRLQLFSHSLA